MNFDTEKELALKCINNYEFTKNQFTTLTSEIEELKGNIKTLNDSLRLSKLCSTKFLDQIDVLAALITDALSIVLGDGFEFMFELVYDDTTKALKGIKTKMKSPEGHMENPLTSFGESGIQIINIVLRMILLSLLPSTKPILIIDEGFSNVNSSLRKKLDQIVETLAVDGGTQIISVSHMQTDMDSTYEVEKINGISRAKKRSI
jgi:hypothetical protein